MIIGRKYDFLYGVGAVWHRLTRLGIAAAVCRSDFVRQICFGICCRKDSSCQLFAARAFFIHLDNAVRLGSIFGQMKISVGIGTLISCLRHIVCTHNLRTAFISDMDNEIGTVISTGIDRDMHMRVFGCSENNYIARRQLTSVYICGTCTDFLDFSRNGKVIQCCLPGRHRLSSRHGCVHCVRYILRVCAFNIRQIVAQVICHKACTAQAVLLKCRNIGRFSGCCTAV